MTLIFWIAFNQPGNAFDQPEYKPCVVDSCEAEICSIETPEGTVEAKKKPSYYEGKRLSAEECPTNLIDPT
jgi:hypothetical protein